MSFASDLLANAIYEKLSECTEEQQALFARMYPDGPSDDQLKRALDQVERTLTKNRKAVSDD